MVVEAVRGGGAADGPAQDQSAVYPQDIEDALDYLTMQVQQLQDQVNRSIVFLGRRYGGTDVPLASARAGLALLFNSNGNPIAGAGINPSVTVSSAMIPVVTAATTAAALTGPRLAWSVVGSSDPGRYDVDYSLTTAPTGFVFPFGQHVRGFIRYIGTALVAAGSPYGTNGTDPLMPDRRSTVPAGKSNMGGVDNGLLTGGSVLGAVLGTQTKTLYHIESSGVYTIRNCCRNSSLSRFCSDRVRRHNLSFTRL